MASALPFLLDRVERFVNGFPVADGTLAGPLELVALCENKSAFFAFRGRNDQMPAGLRDGFPDVFQMAVHITLRYADGR